MLAGTTSALNRHSDQPIQFIDQVFHGTFYRCVEQKSSANVYSDTLTATAMYRFFSVLVLVLSLMLPAFGSMPAAEPCPMQSAMADMDHAGSEAPCCEDMSDTSSSGSKSPCKSGQECNTSVFLQSMAIKPFAPLRALPETALIQPLAKREPASLWRPPRVS